MPFASQLRSSLSGLCTCLLAHLLADQQIILIRLRGLTHRQKLVTTSLANTQKLVKLVRENSKAVKLDSPKPKFVRPNREPNNLALRNSITESCRGKFPRNLLTDQPCRANA